jgi:6-phosphogluconolactonase
MDSVRTIERKGIQMQVSIRARALVGAATAVCALGAPAAALAHDHGGGAVFTLSNATSGNRVIVFHRGAHGALTRVASYATGGLGSGTGAGSTQGALTLAGRLLFAVNPGSNDVSVFRVRGDRLRLVDREPSHGLTPLSITVHDRLAYVLNTGGVANVSGFAVGHHGHLRSLGSTRPLSAGAAGPAQVAFTPRGDRLVVTEKASNTIDTFAIGHDGRAGAPISHASSGATPFGFAFGRNQTLVVSEAGGGPGGTSAVSSYDLRHGGFSTVTASAPNDLKAACWLVTTRDGRYAFVANAASDTISTHRVHADGSVEQIHAGTGQVGTGAHPIDEALSRGDRYLYVLDTLTHQVSGFAIGAGGALGAAFATPANGLPSTALGLAAS